MKNKFIFYLLSFTWGLPLTLLGCIVALVLRIAGKKPVKYGWCWCIEVGKNWGGFNMGPIFLVGEGTVDYTKNHEVGHAIQNTWFGIFTPFVVTIPSSIRYWYRIFRSKIGRPCTTAYDDIWFEGQASRLGAELMYRLNKL